MPVLSKEFFLDIQAAKECRFSLKRVCDMIRTHGQFDDVFPASKVLSYRLKTKNISNITLKIITARTSSSGTIKMMKLA